MCTHSRIVRATNISALIMNGHLAGQSLEDKRPVPNPMRYDQVDFCANPTCEKVFRATKEASHE